MADLEQVDHDPFGLTPVDHDPFALTPVDHDPFNPILSPKQRMQSAFDAAAEYQRRWGMPGIGTQLGSIASKTASLPVDALMAGPKLMGDYVEGRVPEGEMPGRSFMTMMNYLGPGAMAAERGTVGALGGKPTGITAYHGSPHDFDKFDLSKIGTGEGQQAFGHGLYFAEGEGVARSYREKLAGQAVDWNDARSIATHFYNYDPGTAVAKIDRFLDRPGSSYNHEALREAKRLIESGEPLGESPGTLYRVLIRADREHFLDWDKPLSEQHPKVQQAIAAHYEPTIAPTGVNPNLVDVSVGKRWIGVFDQAEIPKDPEALKRFAMQNDPRTGAAIYRELFKATNAMAASQALREAGIPGIKYLDAGSRAEGAGTRNFVVFDDKLVDILKKYGIAGIGALPAMGAYHFQTHNVDHDPFASQ